MTDTFGALLNGILWIVQGIAYSFVNLFNALVSIPSWLGWVNWDKSTEDKEALVNFIYYGGSTEFFFFCFTVFLVIFLVGLWNRNFLWGVTRVLEGFANRIGRFAAWSGLIMVLLQVVIVIMQRVFARPDMVFGFGVPLQFDISWYAESLKFFNAIVVTLCVTYTFVQSGHVRVDLIYAGVSHRVKRAIDMFGALFFMMPVAVLVWMYGWFFMWRHLVRLPGLSASMTQEKMMKKTRILDWSVETIGFSPNGFNGYFLFKILLVMFAGMVFIHAWAFFYRSYLEWKEGEESAGKFVDKDTLGEGEEAYEGTH